MIVLGIIGGFLTGTLGMYVMQQKARSEDLKRMFWSVRKQGRRMKKGIAGINFGNCSSDEHTIDKSLKLPWFS